MPFRQYMTEVDHLDHLIMLRWLEDDWNNPDKVCWYLMQLTAHVRSFAESFGDNPQGVALKSMKIDFPTYLERVAKAEEEYREKHGDKANGAGEEGVDPDVLTPEAMKEAVRTEMRWLRMLGVGRMAPGETREVMRRREPDGRTKEQRVKGKRVGKPRGGGASKDVGKEASSNKDGVTG
jgi:hypothetical protein